MNGGKLEKNCVYKALNRSIILSELVHSTEVPLNKASQGPPAWGLPETLVEALVYRPLVQRYWYWYWPWPETVSEERWMIRQAFNIDSRQIEFIKSTATILKEICNHRMFHSRVRNGQADHFVELKPPNQYGQEALFALLGTHQPDWLLDGETESYWVSPTCQMCPWLCEEVRHWRRCGFVLVPLKQPISDSET